MQVTLIRHAATKGNSLRQYIGRTDEPLSSEGVACAKQAGIDPQTKQVYVSPLQRTRQTASILFPNAKQIAAADLREMDFGVFEGKNFADLEHDAAYRSWVENGCVSACPNGESRGEFSKRVCEAFSHIISAAAAQGETSLVFVVHGGTIMAIMEQFALPREDYYFWSVKNTHGYRCQVSLSPLTLTDPEPWGAIL